LRKNRLTKRGIDMSAIQQGKCNRAGFAMTDLESSHPLAPGARSLDSFALRPIGVVRSPIVERGAAPRQPRLPGSARFGQEVAARIELLAGCGFEDALAGLEAWSHLWVIFVFHKNVEQGRGFRPKVLPPRGARKQGVFATRSPHRPNPIGLSAVRMERVEGLIVHVGDCDMLDGTPVLDLKPYLPYADARAGSVPGWLDGSEEAPSWQVRFNPDALEQLEWLRKRGVALRQRIEEVLSSGPQPHAYRRIRPHGAGMRLAIKEWRADFAVSGRDIVVGRLASGYRPRDLACGEGSALHREFAARFPSPS
jgi:tRNA-Thr(GGU) m(6)t(6)A37 methyltransferase TsaA